MNTITVKIHCAMCGKFRVEHKIAVNEYGYFTLSDSYCPECLSVLICVVDKEENDGPRNTTH